MTLSLIACLNPAGPVSPTTRQVVEAAIETAKRDRTATWDELEQCSTVRGARWKPEPQKPIRTADASANPGQAK